MKIPAGLKKGIAFTGSMVMICLGFAWITHIGDEDGTDRVYAAEDTVITLRIGDANMMVNGISAEIDPGRGTVPVIENDRTLLPVRSIVEAVGGSVEWKQETQTAELVYNDTVIRLVINSSTAYVNDAAQMIDTAPVIINDRTMLPIRFIAENFGFDVGWEQETQMVTITVPGTEDTAAESTAAPADDNTGGALPEVYMTTDISTDALMAIYEQLSFTPQGNIAIKLSTGEAGNTHYL